VSGAKSRVTGVRRSAAVTLQTIGPASGQRDQADPS